MPKGEKHKKKLTEADENIKKLDKKSGVSKAKYQEKRGKCRSGDKCISICCFPTSARVLNFGFISHFRKWKAGRSKRWKTQKETDKSRQALKETAWEIRRVRDSEPRKNVTESVFLFVFSHLLCFQGHLSLQKLKHRACQKVKNTK